MQRTHRAVSGILQQKKIGSEPSFNCDSVTHAQIEYLERRFWKKTTRVQKKFMFKQVFQSGENYTDQTRLKWF